MSLKDVQKNWNEFGRTDPLWAILTVPEKKNNQWKVEEFFESGRREIAEVMTYVETLPVSLARRHALDFGCGVGRLTQALGDYFETCAGIDIAASMIEQARAYNRHGERCQYYLNESDDLSLFADNTFDFVYSVIVLQHMAPRYSRKYIQEFFRILAPGGVAIFQIPAELKPAPAANPEPLPEAAFRARLTLLNCPVTLPAGAQATLRVKVQNVSETSWPLDLRHPIRVGNHWRNAAGRVVIIDDGRANLPGSLKPDEECEVELTITAPRRAGNYQVEVDLVQEQIAWFKDKGSTSVIANLQVSGSLPDTFRILRQCLSKRMHKPSDVLPPAMEMHGVIKSEVITLIEQHQGQVLAVQPDQWAGPAWESYTYCAVKT